MVAFVSVYCIALVAFLVFIVKVNLEYRQSIIEGKISKEDIEKERQDMIIW